MNSRVPEIAIYYACTRVLSSQQREQLARVPDNELAHIAATTLVWTAVILKSSETSAPISETVALKLYS